MIMVNYILKYPIYILDINFLTKFNISYLYCLITTKFYNINTIKKVLNYEQNYILYTKLSHKMIKTKNLISSSNKKLRLQKGLGKSRIGSAKSILLKGGGSNFIVHPHTLLFNYNKKLWKNIFIYLYYLNYYKFIYLYIPKYTYYNNLQYLYILLSYLPISSKVYFLNYTSNLLQISVNTLTCSDLIQYRFIIYCFL